MLELIGWIIILSIVAGIVLGLADMAWGLLMIICDVIQALLKYFFGKITARKVKNPAKNNYAVSIFIFFITFCSVFIVVYLKNR